MSRDWGIGAVFFGIKLWSFIGGGFDFVFGGFTGFRKVWLLRFVRDVLWFFRFFF